MSINIGDLLGSLTGGNKSAGAGASGGTGGGSANLLQSLLPVLLPLLAGGGLSKILGGLQAKGLTSQVDSWTADGPNQPVSPEDITEALGRDELNNVAEQAGVSPDEAAAGISQLLPGLVDKVSHGEVPQGQADQPDLGDMLGSLAKQLGA